MAEQAGPLSQATARQSVVAEDVKVERTRTQEMISVQEQEVLRKAKILEETFASFGFNVKVVEIETGPVIAQGVVEVRDEDDESALHERIKEVERRLLVEVVGRLARNGYRIEGRKVVIQ